MSPTTYGLKGLQKRVGEPSMVRLLLSLCTKQKTSSGRQFQHMDEENIQTALGSPLGFEPTPPRCEATKPQYLMCSISTHQQTRLWKYQLMEYCHEAQTLQLCVFFVLFIVFTPVFHFCHQLLSVSLNILQSTMRWFQFVSDLQFLCFGCRLCCLLSFFFTFDLASSGLLSCFPIILLLFCICVVHKPTKTYTMKQLNTVRLQCCSRQKGRCFLSSLYSFAFCL